MAIVCFDTHVLIWGIKHEAHASQQAMIERANALIQQCADRKDSVLIPAVVVGEALCSAPPETQERMFQTFSEHFLIVPYDARAALVNARIWQEQAALRQELREQQVWRQAIKVDIQIVAIAVANRCNVLYTEDGPLYEIAKRYLDVKKISEVQLPAHQPKLLKD